MNLVFGKFRKLFVWARQSAHWLIAIQCAVYAFAYDAMMPQGLYYSPDSLAYLSFSKVAPPTFSLLLHGLIRFELAVGSARLVLLRYLMIAVYTLGGVLVARAFLRAQRPLLAFVILPAIWAMSSMTQWLNYVLTDGLSTAFLLACIGAYGNLYVSLQDKQSPNSRIWLFLFVLFGMISFSLRPAFAFIAPCMVWMLLNKAVFSWRRLAEGTVAIAILAAMHFSFSRYFHGQAPSQLGGVLTALVFDLPIEKPCPAEDQTDLCKVQRALQPYIEGHKNIPTEQEKFVYKAANNGALVQDARNAVTDKDPNYIVLLEIAKQKIKSNPLAYLKMVLKNSYFSIKLWGDWAWNDSFDNVAVVNTDITNQMAPAIREKILEITGLEFDPTIKHAPLNRIYKHLLLHPVNRVFGPDFVKDFILLIVAILLVFSVLPLFLRLSLSGSLLFACCLLTLIGTVFQNCFFPVIPRLLDPFHPLGALAFSFCLDLIRELAPVKMSFQEPVIPNAAPDKPS